MPQKLDTKDAKDGRSVVIFKHLEWRLLCDKVDDAWIYTLRKKYIVLVYVGFVNGLTARQIELADGVICEKHVIAADILQKTQWIRQSGFNYLANEFANEPPCDKSKRNLVRLAYIGNLQPRKKAFAALRTMWAYERAEPSGSVLPPCIVVNGSGNSLLQRCSLALFISTVRLLWPGGAEAFIGDKVPPSLVKDLLKKSSVLVFPSRAEGAARICAEAMCLGTRVALSKACNDGTQALINFSGCAQIDGAGDLRRLLATEVPLESTAAVKKFCNADQSFELLCREIRTRYSVEVIQFTGSKAGFLPCHTNRYPARVTSDHTDEALSSSTLDAFCEQILEVPPARRRLDRSDNRLEELVPQLRELATSALEMFVTIVFAFSAFLPVRRPRA